MQASNLIEIQSRNAEIVTFFGLQELYGGGFRIFGLYNSCIGKAISKVDCGDVYIAKRYVTTSLCT